MKHLLVAVLAATVAIPVVSIPVPADAQVMVGSGAVRRSAPRRPRLTEAEQNRLFEAEEELITLETQIEDLQAAAEGAELTESQRAEMDTLGRRRVEVQAVVDQLQAKRNR